MHTYTYIYCGPVATSEPAVEISAKGRNELVVQNLPEVKPKTTLLGVSSIDTLPQEASTSNTPAVGEGLGHLVSGVGGLSVCARRKLKNARAEASKAGTGSSQQLGNAPFRSQVRRTVPPQKRPELRKGLGTLRDQGFTRRI
jgi:hypothetical protein